MPTGESMISWRSRASSATARSEPRLRRLVASGVVGPRLDCRNIPPARQFRCERASCRSARFLASCATSLRIAYVAHFQEAQLAGWWVGVHSSGNFGYCLFMKASIRAKLSPAAAELCERTESGESVPTAAVRVMLQLTHPLDGPTEQRLRQAGLTIQTAAGDIVTARGSPTDLEAIAAMD